jgi:hypothetical protein
LAFGVIFRHLSGKMSGKWREDLFWIFLARFSFCRSPLGWDYIPLVRVHRSRFQIKDLVAE